MGSIFKGKKPDTGAQEAQIAKQKQAEDLRLAEAKDETERRKALAKGKTAGRSLLVATSETGAQKDTLGG